MKAPAYGRLSGTALLLLLIGWTLLPFASLFTAALHESGTYPSGLDWPSHPHWGNFVDAFHVANMGTIFKSSVLIVLGAVPLPVVIATMAGFALGQLRVVGGQFVFVLFLLGLTLPFEGIAPDLAFALAGVLIIVRSFSAERAWALIGAGAGEVAVGVGADGDEEGVADRQLTGPADQQGQPDGAHHGRHQEQARLQPEAAQAQRGGQGEDDPDQDESPAQQPEGTGPRHVRSPCCRTGRTGARRGRRR